MGLLSNAEVRDAQQEWNRKMSEYCDNIRGPMDHDWLAVLLAHIGERLRDQAEYDPEGECSSSG